jgi:hypothetical protein
MISPTQHRNGFKGLALAVIVALLLVSTCHAAPMVPRDVSNNIGGHYRIGIAVAVSQRVANASASATSTSTPILANLDHRYKRLANEVNYIESPSTAVTSAPTSTMAPNLGSAFAVAKGIKSQKEKFKKASSGVQRRDTKDSSSIDTPPLLDQGTKTVTETASTKDVMTTTVVRVAATMDSSATSAPILAQVPIATVAVAVVEDSTTTMAPVQKNDEKTTTIVVPASTVTEAASTDIPSTTRSGPHTYTVTVSVTESATPTIISSSSSASHHHHFASATFSGSPTATSAPHHHHHHHDDNQGEDGYIPLTIMVPETFASVIAGGEKPKEQLTSSSAASAGATPSARVVSMVSLYLGTL